ncbi:hypothetical protein FA15DRAFT_247079 [Coprinopsis marcescibilis]|uniref:Uncharacterized protein n=1 Tax=Coprinopsis marcescibilis TaxID=230819 RepID=A0A5C3L4C0_COPMA|nr:hypothetical protein FA15DRAFT_247079 [Coprinopsis marcescibilis]
MPPPLHRPPRSLPQAIEQITVYCNYYSTLISIAYYLIICSPDLMSGSRFPKIHCMYSEQIFRLYPVAYLHMRYHLWIAQSYISGIIWGRLAMARYTLISNAPVNGPGTIKAARRLSHVLKHVTMCSRKPTCRTDYHPWHPYACGQTIYWLDLMMV